MAMKAVKKSTTVRERALRIDASVKTGERKIERAFGLPPGCVQLVLPSGRAARSDKKIKKLFKEWNW
jgi:hypothetical protein